LELLEISLHTLDPVVDRFVLVEATRTYSNKPKPLYFEENKAAFLRFLPKIVHVIVDDFPVHESAWSYENHQRNQIMRGLSDCRLNDMILISDVDEIPNPVAVLSCKDMEGIKVLFYYYYLNCQKNGNGLWDGTRMLSFSDLLSYYDHHVSHESYYNLRVLNNGTTPNRIRCTQGKPIPDGGWHFSYLGGTERIMEKIAAFAHQEFNTTEFNSFSNIDESLQTGRDLYHRELQFHEVELDDTFPSYILANRQKFQHLLKEKS
jgi:beta-1,4-mannosyl-glycoprotein beta-1,4-N-acetylglucosaminyltransferase